MIDAITDAERDERYIRRCFDLARQATNKVKSNPNVGAVLVYNDRIIGEGYHEKYGGSHAEVNALNNVKPLDQKHIKDATLFVSLEPCNHHGKTPPCVEAIVNHHIKKVVISCSDPNPLMMGKSFAKLRAAGIKVKHGVLEEVGRKLIKPFVTTTFEKRPYIILKQAQSYDGYLGNIGEQTWLTNTYSKVLAHKWRGEVDGILVGANTIRIDNPSLTTRDYPGQSPIRIVIDQDDKLDQSHTIYKDNGKTITISKRIERLNGVKQWLKFDIKKSGLRGLMEELLILGIYRLLVEGGAITLKGFLDENLWDEARVFRTSTPLHEGVIAPKIEGSLENILKLDGDEVLFITHRPEGKIIC